MRSFLFCVVPHPIGQRMLAPIQMFYVSAKPLTCRRHHDFQNISYSFLGKCQGWFNFGKNTKHGLRRALCKTFVEFSEDFVTGTNHSHREYSIVSFKSQAINYASTKAPFRTLFSYSRLLSISRILCLLRGDGHLSRPGIASRLKRFFPCGTRSCTGVRILPFHPYVSI